MKTYEKIAYTIDAIKNCQKNNNAEWEDRHIKTLETLVKTLPHG